MTNALQSVALFCQSRLLSCTRQFFNFNAALHGLTRAGKTDFLSVTSNTTSIIPVAGFKRHVAVHRRCPDCRMLRINNRLTVLCDTHPRHKQIQMGRRGQKRLHRPYPWRWPDPFEKNYGSSLKWDRYEAAFEK